MINSIRNIHDSVCPDNEELWENILNGDRGALSKLFNRFYAPLLNYGCNLISREDLVKDSIQELFFTIWTTREKLSDVEYVSSYIYTSFRRTVIRHSDLMNVRKERDKSYSEESFEQLLNKEQLMISNELKVEQKKQLKKAFGVLTKKQKEAIFLKFQNGLSNQEIATVMNVNKQSVYNYIYRAIGSLQKYLDEEEPVLMISANL